MSLQVILFDLDGTLIDSVPDVAGAVNRMLQQHGRETLSVDKICSMVGLGVEYLIDCAMQATGEYDSNHRQQYIDDYMQQYRDHPVIDTKIYPGVNEVLSAFQQDGFNMGVCTNKPHQMSVTVLDKLNISQYFSAVVGAGSIPFKKPDARHIEMTLQKMGVNHKHAVMVGDSETDIKAAKNFGIPSVLVNYGYLNDPNSVKDADIVINHFRDLPNAIARLTQ